MIDEGCIPLKGFYRRRQIGKGRTKKPGLHGINKYPCLLLLLLSVSSAKKLNIRSFIDTFIKPRNTKKNNSDDFCLKSLC
jgi:hypothetical protein